ncbi:hypothetical protein GLV98_07760 [Halobacillus litoralis]|uniref:Ribbon-helix-helix protein CopG domain-containing protein n=1 Tax=Halobacillus litoralis TaxID=45668 RepID=A0A845E5C2_9BACI|nr:ribbon-helix-helix domain-containing protein [Halobacillus litoralis]MYL49376.1 hypothetical protein [Halobacillus litoralis]
MKKQVSVRVSESLNDEIEQKAKELGLSKSSFISFSTQFFLNQLNHMASSPASKSVNMYELLRTNMENTYKE